jgi:hypothetical protein
MFSNTILTIAFCCVTLLNFSGESNACCFTMPPKVVKVSKWAFSIPNVDSSSYIHESHECPSKYSLESQHSHIISELEPSIRLISTNILNINIYGYSVCCEEKINSYYARISVKNNTDHHI